MKKVLFLLVSILAVIVFLATRLVERDPAKTTLPTVTATVSDIKTEPSLQKTPDSHTKAVASINSVEEIPEFLVGSETEALDMLAALGIDDSLFQEQLTRWGVQYGVSIGWQQDVQNFLDQPYGQYDDTTLKGLSDDGSMWAQQILGGRWFSSRPAEAQELFRQAAARGSLQAAASLANLYRAVAERSEDSLDIDAGTLEQIYALNDGPESPKLLSYAWSVVEEKMWQAPVTPRVQLSPDEVTQACALADSLFQDLQSIRTSNRLDPMSISNPPMFLPQLLGKDGSGCFDSEQARDVSNCRGARIKSSRDGNSQPIWFCVE